MIRLGICTAVANAAAVKAAGWDFVEENVQSVLQGNVADDAWKGRAAIEGAALPVLSANCLVPGAMKITGPVVDLAALQEYMTRVVRRAADAGVKLLVFGSGGARQVPEGFDRTVAIEQIVEFAKMAAPIAQAAGVTLAIEPLHPGECNVINTLAEAMAIVRKVGNPRFRCLFDSYHFWRANDRIEDLRDAMPWIAHVHLADNEGRTAPGESGTSDYRTVFRVLKDGGFGGLMSVEASGFSDYVNVAPRVLTFVREQWKTA